MDNERPPSLRTVGSTGEETTASTGGERLGTPFAVNETAELVVDLLSATGLVAPDKLALVRGRAGRGSLAQAIVDEGVAPPEGVARTLALRHQVPLRRSRALRDRQGGRGARSRCTCSSASSRSRTRSRATRCGSRSPIPATSTASTSCGSPRATPLELGVASRDDILVELKRMARASEAFGARAVLEEAEESLDRRGGRGRRPRGRRRHLRRAARPPRQLGHLPGGRGRRLATSTSSRRRTRSSSASASTACSRRCSGSRSG